jgi:hypothetical protein
MAYWDQSEIPINLDQTKWGNLEGTGGNPGYSSAIQGVLNYCGAIADTTWIQAGEPPVGCFHGLLDNIVPPNNGVSLDFGIRLFGGVAINRIADRLGIFTKGAFFPTMGHGTGGDPTFGDSLLSFTVDFFYSLVKQNTAVEIEASALPSSFHLMNNYPNPFNPATIIGYHIPNKTTVRLCVMDVAGRTVATLVDCTNEAGYHEVVWDAECMPSGTYFYRIIAGSFIETKSMILLK